MKIAAAQRELTFDRHFLCRYGPTIFFRKNEPPFRRQIRRNPRIYKDATVAKPELGTKRICPETGRKFYDLNKDPIVSPYTGKTYPLSFFEDTKPEIIEEKVEKVVEAEAEIEEEDDTADAEVVSLEDAEEEEDTSKDDNLPDLGDNTDDEIEIDDDEDDTFLADDEDDDDDDVTGIIDVAGGDDDET
jgi:uncharacterized protein (TIGR02300 family)